MASTSQSSSDNDNRNTSGRRLRTHNKRINYSEDIANEEIIEKTEGVSYNLQKKINSKLFLIYGFVKKIHGKELNISFVQKHKFRQPILCGNKNNIVGLTVPPSTFGVKDVCRLVGPLRNLDVMDVDTQNNIEMSMQEWTMYYENPIKDKLLNVISLEFSLTKLDKLVQPPNIVRELDWVNCVWPKHLKESQTESTNVMNDMKYPKVQKYCLMSVKGSFTDFHIDFGGSSVWYHILKGKKIFWLIPYGNHNLKRYEEWTSGKLGNIFFGDCDVQCERVELVAGTTFFIPSGWIHAVYTSEDSIVFGGNFLHSFSIEKQLRVAEIEKSAKVNQKHRYPFFYEMQWFFLERYVHCNLGTSHLKEGAETCFSAVEHIHFTRLKKYAILAIIKYLTKSPKKEAPPLIKNHEELLINAINLLKKPDNDNPEDGLAGKKNLRLHVNKDKKKGSHKSAGNSSVKIEITQKSTDAGFAALRRRRTRCTKCQACKEAECGKCRFCLCMVKFGGWGRAKQTCIWRQCIEPILPVTAICRVCLLDGWNRKIVFPVQKPDHDIPSSLMECRVCFEIVHPQCLLNQSEINNTGVKIDTLPNSWKCPKCCNDGENLETEEDNEHLNINLENDEDRGSEDKRLKMKK